MAKNCLTESWYFPSTRAGANKSAPRDQCQNQSDNHGLELLKQGAALGFDGSALPVHFALRRVGCDTSKGISQFVNVL